MTDEKKRRKGIGSIGQFTTLGNAQESERPDTEEPETQNTLASQSENTQSTSSLNVKIPKDLSTQESNTQSIQELENYDSKTTENSDAQSSDSQELQESKRFVQVSETELKRLMTEVLQSQSTNISKPKKPQRLRQTVYLEPELHNKIRHRIADTGEDISDVVNLALKQLLQ